jgi:hypothetical protein
MARQHPEDVVQKAIVNWLRNVLRGEAMVVHIANNPRSARDGARLKALGLVAGAPDLLVVLPHGRGCFIEVKSQKGRVQEAQKAFELTCRALDWPWLVARSIDDVRSEFKVLGILTREAA